jgi:polysaccharide biosynthesis transport protein
VTSVLPAEGKTTLARGLAATYAASGVRTLLIDANIDNPSLTRQRQAIDGDGFLELLVEPHDFETRILPGGPGEADFLPVGRSPGGLECLRDPLGGWQEVLTRQLLAAYEVIVLDTAALSDPGTVALVSPGGGVIIVCDHGEATKTGLEEGVGILADHPVAIMGAIINRSPRKVRAARRAA